MAKRVCVGDLRKLAGSISTPSRCILPPHARCFSVLNRPPPNYEGHIPLTVIERLGLAVGSGLGSFLDPRRADLIASFGEATAQPHFIYKLRDRMLLNPTGRRILRDRPRLTSTSLDIPRLRQLPPNTLGYVYALWLDREGVSPDTRATVQYIDDEECAYVMQRYRECHDFYHALVGLPVFREGEVALKAFEFANTGLPMTGLAVFSAFTLKKAEWRRFWDIYGPWATRNGAQSDDVINIYWEEELETDIDQLRTRLGIEKPPDLREMRKAEREAQKKDKEAKETMTRAAV
ncbi:ubiquinone biosynthesis protein COQ4 [Parastagonospora nodorum]|nr:ubiquinone biosynthesis protein COQ4 [Parastagonospora nodorum]KAH3986934.1 ubiquinone biosynthesis protein COQ4 [Parastagonospora nodorum]KAH3987558.1 ubiquinone biosynthesis protein COQ4 [Parastagonospora nodorum]KAH4001030.1 ubiquinone biosynthesis protein COQ4 [Parastagonospora nodorum]KAH4033477.1 ubiquinone biosynthesis protein COQ4 [Parastagonospora nodorum]